jgi:hypothetical protein
MSEHCADLGRRDILRALTTSAGAVGNLLLFGTINTSSSPRLDVLKQNQPQTPIMPDTAVRTLEIGTVTAPEMQFDQIDSDALMKAARDAGAQCVMIYSMEHWGYALYDTWVGYKHPNLHYDYVGKQVEAARRYGLSPLCYYSYNFATEVALRHPDWCMLTREGKPQKFVNRFYMVCQNSPYGEFMLETFRELFRNYGFDGLFLDIFPAKPCFYSVGSDPSPFCFCKYCLALWEKEKGTPFLAGLDTAEGRRERIAWTRQKSGDQFVDRIYKVIREYRPDATLGGNGGCLFYWRSLIEKLSYNYGEPEFSPSGVCLGSALMRGWGKPGYQEGVWLRDRRTIGDLVPTSVIRTEAAAELAQGARLFAVGSLVLGHLPRGFDSRTMAAVKDTLRDSVVWERWLQGTEPVPCVAVVSGEATFDQYIAEEHPADCRDSVFGALELLTSTHYPFDAVPDWRLSDDLLRNYQAVVLPETEVLTDAQGRVLRDYVRRGGTLIASWKCGMKDEKGGNRDDFLLADVMGVSFGSEVDKYVGNVRNKSLYRGGSIFLEPLSHPLAQSVGKEPVGLAGAYLTVTGPAEEVFRLRPPLFAEDLSKGVFFHWPPPPAGTEEAGKGVTVFRYGQGRALYLAVELFREYRRSPSYWVKDWIHSVLRQLIPSPLVRLEAGKQLGYFHATFSRTPQDKRLLIQIVNSTASVLRGEVAPIREVRVVANAQKLSLHSAKILWPEEIKLECTRRGDEWEIPLPDIGIYTVVGLDLAN